jgi:maleylpyruvate isomerase
MTFQPATLLAEITEETERLLDTAAAFTDDEVRQPSLLPGWTRGHVLTHVARNADGGTRLLTWARTGIPTPEYASPAARADEIEAGHGRPAGELLHDVRAQRRPVRDRVPADARGRLGPDAAMDVRE